MKLSLMITALVFNFCVFAQTKTVKIKKERYFLVSYSTNMKDGNRSIDGNIYFQCNGFPNKSDLDSVIYAGLEYKRYCYQKIIIRFIFEFKNKQDAEMYNYDADWDSKKEKVQVDCDRAFKPLPEL